MKDFQQPHSTFFLAGPPEGDPVHYCEGSQLSHFMTRLFCKLVLGLALEHSFSCRHCLSFTRRSERLAKYNQLLRIEEELGSNAVYAGENWRHIGW